jgi:hypothetical protein
MGLEITGFTRANLDLLWIDPYEYKHTLSDRVSKNASSRALLVLMIWAS